MKKTSILMAALLAVAAGYANAEATSVLDAGMKTAMIDGFGSLKETIVDVIKTMWPYMLGVLALTTAPTIVRKFFKMTAKG